MKIGITERGDPARDLSWTNTVRNCDGAIIITKAITNALAKNLLQLNQEGFPVMLHATCTGYGGTILEPHVPNYAAQLTSITHMIQHGFPQDHIVLRIDPIIPTSEGVDTATKVLDAAASMNIIPGCRVRISILDEYRHVKARLAAAGLPQNFPGQFTANLEQRQYLTDALKPYAKQFGIQFECCAEKYLTDPIFVHQGCISHADLRTMGLPVENMSVNPQNRNGCLCLSCKHELLNNKHRCPHQCLYCYWQD